MTRRQQLLQHYEAQRNQTESRVSEGIERYRKGTATLRLVDREGIPLPSARVKTVLRNHAFLNGCNLFGLDQLGDSEKNALYREKFKDAFNAAVLPIYWSPLEPEHGQHRFKKDSPFIYRRPPLELCLDYCEEHHIRPKAHCLNYFQRGHYPAWCPDSIPEAMALCETRFRELAERYAHRIPDWDVINETLGSFILPDNPPIFYMPDSIEWSFELARKYFGNGNGNGNRFFINDDPPTVWGDLRGDRRAYYLQIDRALSRGCQIDVIGLQSHMIYERYDPRLQDILCNPALTFSTMDLYAGFGRPLQISEVSLPAYSPEAEDEEIQAEWLRHQYSIWFSHPAVEGIMYWDLVDGNAPAGELGAMDQGWNAHYAGLLRFDMSEKPAFKMMKHLFREEWHTEESFVTNETGCASFRGFYGTYRLEIECNGRCEERSVTFTKDTVGEITVCCDTNSQ